MKRLYLLYSEEIILCKKPRCQLPHRGGKLTGFIGFQDKENRTADEEKEFKETAAGRRRSVAGRRRTTENNKNVICHGDTEAQRRNILRVLSGSSLSFCASVAELLCCLLSAVL
jgi:hypothetical protein